MVMEIMICFIIVVFLFDIYRKKRLLILSQEYFINGNDKCKCQQTAGCSKQTAPGPGYVICLDGSGKNIFLVLYKPKLQ